jgi:hypothetical protein
MSDGCIRWYSSSESESRHLREGREDTRTSYVTSHSAFSHCSLTRNIATVNITFALPCVGTNKRVPLWPGELPCEMAMYASARALGKSGGHCTALHCLRTLQRPKR